MARRRNVSLQNNKCAVLQPAHSCPHPFYAHTKQMNKRTNEQTDMIVYRGHLDPHKPQSNISFAETIARDKPDIIAIQIGENDVMQQPSRGENVSCVPAINSCMCTGLHPLCCYLPSTQLKHTKQYHGEAANANLSVIEWLTATITTISSSSCIDCS